MAPITLKPLPPKEAIDFFRQKGYKIGFDYRDVWQSEHQAAFTVAKAMQLDLLQEIRAQVDSALANGTTFETFRDNLKPNLVQRGWWGRAMMKDPVTGEVKDVQLGSTRRLKVIYDTNLRTAHSEGQWARIQETKSSFPYLQYDHTPSKNERKEHAAWDGLVLPADDPFWQAHYPVKAWGCKCRAIQMTDRMVKQRGLSVSTPPKIPSYEYVNKRTGETQSIPAGVDAAFNYPPGGRRGALTSYLAEKVDNTDRTLAVASVRDLVAGDAFKSFFAKPAGAFPIAVLPKGDAETLGTGTLTVRMSAETMQKQIDIHPEISADEYQAVQDAIDQGERIQDTAKTVIYLWEGGGYVTVVKATKTGKALFMTSFRRLSKDQVKRDEEIKRLLKKGK